MFDNKKMAIKSKFVKNLLLKRKPMEVNFGNPITIDKKTKLTHENEKIIYKQLEDAWDQLDKELNPNFHYVAK